MKTKKGRKITKKFKLYLGYKVDFFNIGNVDLELTGVDSMKFKPVNTCDEFDSYIVYED